MTFTAKEIAEKVKGSIEGDPNVVLSLLSKIKKAKNGSITFLSNPKYTPYIYDTKASAVIVDQNFIPDNKYIQGTPAIDFKEYYKSYPYFKKLSEFEKRLKKIKKNDC